MWDLRRLVSAVFVPLALAALLPGAVASASPHELNASTAEPDGTCGLCVLAPSGTSLRSTGNGDLVVNGANIVVNSRGTPAVKVTGNARITAQSVGVAGTVSTRPGAIANLTTGITPIADPLAGLPVPSVPRPPVVPSVSVPGSRSLTISPGVYKNVSVSGNGRLTLNAGTYVILGKFSSTGNGIVAGDGVSLYLACASYPTECAPGTKGAGLSLTGNGAFGLTGPEGSCAATVQADPNNGASIRLTGNGRDTLTGIVYAPAGALVLTGNGSSFALGAKVVVGTATVTGNGNITVDPGSAQCEPAAPEAVATSGETREDESAPIVLTGRTRLPETLTFVLTQPQHGSAAIAGSPSCTTAPNAAAGPATCSVTAIYTPEQDFFGGDGFTFTVGDGTTTSDPAAVTMETAPVNDPPVTGPDSAAGTQDTPLPIPAADVLANDVPGPFNESGQHLTVTAVAGGPGTHGTVSLAGATITYTPEAGYSGPATFTYTTCDDGTTAGTPDPRCADGTVSITVAENHAPTGTDQHVTTPEDTPLPITLAGTDPDGNPLTFTIDRQPAKGSLTGTAPNLTYVPEKDSNGVDSFTFVANDGHVDAPPATVVIDVTEVNDPPTAEPDALTVGSGLASQIPNVLVLHNDVAGPANESGQERAVDAVTATPDTHGTVSVGAAAITYTPAPGYVGPASFTYELCDNGTTDGQPDPECVGNGTVALTVTPANQTPTADDQQATTAEDTPKSLFLTGSDPDGDPLTFLVVHQPLHGTLIGAPPALTYLPASDYNGLDEFTYVANDGIATSEPALVALKITEVNDPPVLGSDSATLGGAGTLQPPTRPRCGETCAVIWGDPHMVTFDLANYDFQAVGEFIAAKSTTDDFEMQVRTQPYHPSRLVSMALAVAMRVAGHRVSIVRTLSGMDTRIDGTPLTVPSNPAPLPGGGTIGTYGTANQIIVVWPDGSVAIVSAVGLYPASSRLTVQLGLSAARLTHVVGLLGNADGVPANDIVTRDGLPIAFPPLFTALYPAYADSWRISQAESLFDYLPGETTETFTDRTFPDAPATSAGLPPDVRALATGQCGLFGVTVAEVLEACIVDVGVTGDAEFASSSAAAQEAAYGIPDNTGSASFGVPAAVTIDVAGQTAVRSFTATAGQHMTLTVSDNTIQGADITVRQPNGSTVTSFFVSGPSAFHDAVTLPVAGTYTVTVDPRDQATGSLTLTLGSVPEDSTGQTAIGVPTTVTITTAGENAVRSFTAIAGQHATLTVSDNTIPGVDITVRQPNGSSVASLFVSGPSGFRDTFALPVTGTYTVLVDPRDQNTGSLTFTLGSVPDDSTGQTSIGVPTPITITTPGQDAVRSFDATAGQNLTLTVTANTIAGVSLVVRQPNGTNVTSLFVSGASGFRDTFALPVTGTYTVLVDPSGQLTGSLTFTLGLVPDNTGATAVGTATSVTIGTIGENAVRSFPATAGQNMTLTVSDNTIAGVSLVVRQPNGTNVTSLFVSGASGFRDTFLLPVTGTYTVLVDPSGQLTGSLTFRLDSVPDNTGTTAIGTPTSVTIGTIGEDAVRSFPATAGQNVTLTVSDNTIAGVSLVVRRPNGTNVTSLFVSGASGFRDTFALPVTGTYTVLVDPSGQLTGSLTFRLDLVPDNTGTTAIGTPTSVTIGTIGENAVRSFPATAGQNVTLTVTDNTIAGVSLVVLQPNESNVTSLFVSGASGFRDTFALPVTGTYTVLVDPSGQLTGSLTFRLDSVPDNTGTTAIGTPTSVTIGTIGENAVRSFPATAGQNVTLTVTDNTIAGVSLVVRQPNESNVTSLFVTGPTGFRDAFALPVTGTYTILVDPSGQRTGSLTFTLNDAPAPMKTSAGSKGAGPPSPYRRASDLEPRALASVAAAADPVTLTFPVAALLANDHPGPANEAGQTLTVTAVRTDASSHGTATLSGGTITYTPAPGYTGPATIFYTACDDGTTNGNPDPRCSEGTIGIKVTANHPPTADDQQLATAEDSPLALVLAGDDADGDAVAFTITNAPDHGTLTGTAPNLTYTPAPDFHGADSFTFTANDTHDESQPATVAIAVSEVNDPPAPQADSITAGVGQPATVAAAVLAGNDAAGPFDERRQTLTVAAVTATAQTHGTVMLSGGVLTYTPDAGFAGTATVAYTVCDDGKTAGQPDPRCADGVLSIVANRPPSANDQSAGTAQETPVTIELSGSDPENDPLTFAVVTPPQHGALTGTGATRTYTPAAGFSGPDSFTYTAADAYGTSPPATVAITVSQMPPPIVRPDAVATAVNTSVLIDVLANDTAVAGTLNPATLAIVTQPTNGTAVVESGAIRYTPAQGVAPDDRFTYSVCDTFGGCGQAAVTVAETVPNRPPLAKPDSYDINVGTTLHPAAPGVLANDTDPDPGDKLQARLVRGVTNGNLLLNSTGEFTYTPHGPGIDTFVYHVLDKAGAVSNDATVTIAVSGPPGPPIVSNDLYTVQQGRELDVPAPGVLEDDFSPNPHLALTALLQADAARGTLLLRPNGSFVYTPGPGFTGTDQFSYVVRDSEGRRSQVANVGITVQAGGPPTAVVTAISPAAGARITDRTHVTATLAPPPGETVTSWTLSFRRPGDPTLTALATGTGTAVGGDFDPTTLRNGTYAIVLRAVTSGGGILVNETGVGVEGSYKPGRYSTTFLDVAVNSANIPIDLLRTYDSADKTAGDFGVGWRLELANFRVDTNGPLGAGGWSSYTCGAFPFLATCYTSTKSHFVTVTWPDGHLERFRFAPDQGSSLVPTLTTAGFKAEPGTSSTIAAVDNGLLLSGSDFLLGNFFFADGIYDPLQFVLTDKFGTKYTLDRRAGLLSIVDRNGNRVNIGDDGIESDPTNVTVNALAATSGIAMTFTRDADDRITRIAAPGGNIDYTYSPAGDLVHVSYPNGTSQSFTYDAHHGLLTTGGGGSQVVRTLHYDAAGRVTAITDGEGNTATIDVDVAGHQQVTTDPTGKLTIVNTYDNRGNLIRQSRIAGGKTITTSATYDTLGRQLSATDGLGHTSSKTYDAAGNVLTQTDANGKTTVMTYNAFGQPLTITDPLGQVTTSTYDARGNLTSTVDAGGHTTTNTYDAAGNLLTSIDPAGRTTTYTYDASGQPATMTDPGGNTTHYTVDAASGLLMSETDPAGATTSYTYDAIGHLTSFTDANGHTRTAAYDALNRITSLTDHVGKSVHQVYDANDNLISVTDRNGDTITYSYDANSRLVSKDVPGAGVTTFTYDPFGRLTGAANSVAQLAFTYDDADRVLTAKSTPAVPNALPTSTFTYAYDAAGNVTSTQGPGGTTGYSYDANSQLATMTDPANGVFNFGYDPTGRRTSLTRPNGITDSATYNAAGDLTSLHSTLGATLVNRADYAYNSAGLRSSFTSLSGVTAYTYDSVSQLTSATPPAGGGLPDEQYSYDLVGNRISSATSPLGSFSYDGGDRLLADATTTYTYDDEGNLLTRTDKASGAKTTYTWTAEHQLVRIAYPDNTASVIRYDPLDRRVEIADASAVRRYAFDRQAIAAEYDTSNALAATYILPGNETLCPLEMVRNGQRYFYLVDGLRSTAALTDMSGAVAASYRYQAFGTPLQTGNLENPFQYLCIYIYGIPGLGFPPSGPYDPGTSQSLNDDPISFPGQNPFQGGNFTIPPGPGDGAAGGMGGSGGGGKADEGGGAQCTPNPVQIYPKGKGWKKFSKLPGKLYKKGKPKSGGPRKGGGTEYIAVLPTQETVQAVADFGEVIRCQFKAAAGALSGG